MGCDRVPESRIGHSSVNHGFKGRRRGARKQKAPENEVNDMNLAVDLP